MKPFKWPRSTPAAVRLLPPEHSNIRRVVAQIFAHARAGRKAFARGRLIDAKFHRHCCSELVWRLGVDGLTENGQIRRDGAKYETRLLGRLSSEAARAVRESAAFAHRAQSALRNEVACDHIVPRTCVADVLVCPGWWDPDDKEGGRHFLLSHAEVAIIHPDENRRLRDAGWESDMPRQWWDATLADKSKLVLARYQAKNVKIRVTRWTAQ